MRHIYDDGGRAAAGFKGSIRDCATRAIATAAKIPYQQVYDLVNEAASIERPGSRRRGGRRSSARSGVFKTTFKRIMESLGWIWYPTMAIGSGCQVHLEESELPKGRLIVALSRHYAVIDGVLYDTYDCSRDGTRCVCGYWKKSEDN